MYDFSHSNDCHIQNSKSKDVAFVKDVSILFWFFFHFEQCQPFFVDILVLLVLVSYWFLL